MTTDQPELAPAAVPATAYVVRLATAYLVVPHDTPDRVEYASRVVEALQEDARVTDARAPELDSGWSPHYTAYLPVDESDGESGVLEATRHVHVQQFSDPLAVVLRVPTKNQPKVFDSDDIPSETYFVLWDGELLLVAWPQPADEVVGSSGGHVVEDILERAADRVGAGLVVQACNPQCTYVFLHTAMKVTVDPSSDFGWAIARNEDDPSLLNVTVSDGDSLLDVSLEVWWRVRASMRTFATMKNRGRQILELERIVRYDLDRLNQLHHKRARASQEGLLRRVRAIWTYRAWRRTSRYYLARLWLGLGNLERLRRQWAEDALSFRRASDEEDLEALFAIDTYDEVPLVEQLDLSLLEAAIEHAGDRLGVSVLAATTIGGGVAGAVVAALLATA